MRFANEDTLNSEAGSTTTNERNSSEGVNKNGNEIASLGRLGRFELRTILGQGAFGRVYQAYDPQLDRLLALKVPIFGKDESKKAARFQAEAKAAGKLRHPNIVPVFDSGCIDEQYYIATQYIDGQTLAQVIRDNGEACIDFKQAAIWAKAIASALAYAHHVGIVHRDVKPHNVMLDSRNEPQLMDFGLAKRVNEDAAMTTEGAILGTPAYMAPEQARGDTSQVGTHSDQYAIGAMLYELLTGKRPFEGPPHAVLAQILSAEPPSPSSFRSTVPRDLEAITLKAMSKEVAHRYDSCESLAEDLDRWLKGEATQARPISPLERLTRWSQRNRSLAALTLGIVGVTLLALIGVTLAFFQANSARKLAAANLLKAQEQTQIASDAVIKALATAHELSEALEEVKKEKERAVAAETLAKTNALNAEKALKELQAAQDATLQKVREVETQKNLVVQEMSRADSLLDRSARMEKSAIAGRYQQLVQSIQEAIENRKPLIAKANFDEGKKGNTDGWEWNYLGNLIRSALPKPLIPGDSVKATFDKLLRDTLTVKHIRDGSRLIVLAKNQVGLFDVATGKLVAHKQLSELGADGSTATLTRVLDCVQLENSFLFLCWAEQSSRLIGVRYQNDDLQVSISGRVSNYTGSHGSVDLRVAGNIQTVRPSPTYLNCGALTFPNSQGAGIGVINSSVFLYQLYNDRIEVVDKRIDQAVFCDVISKSIGAFTAANFDTAKRGGMATVDAEQRFQRTATELRSTLLDGRVTLDHLNKFPIQIQCGPWYNSLVPNLSACSVTKTGVYLATSEGKIGYMSNLTKTMKPLANLGSKVNCISVSENEARLALALEDRTVRIIETKSFSEIEKIAAQDFPIVATSIAADSKSVVTISPAASESKAMLYVFGSSENPWQNYEGKVERASNIVQSRFIDDQTSQCVAVINSTGALFVDEVTGSKFNRRSVSRTPVLAPTLSRDGKYYVGFDPAKVRLLIVDLSLAQKPVFSQIDLSESWGATLAIKSAQERKEWAENMRLFVDPQRRAIFAVSPSYLLEAHGFSGALLFRRKDANLQKDMPLFLTSDHMLVTQQAVLGTTSESGDIKYHRSRHRPFLLLDKLLVSATSDVIYSSSLESKTNSEAEFVGHLGAITNVIATSKGDRLISASLDRSVRIWDTQSTQQLLKLYTSNQPIADIDLSADENFLLITKNNGEAVVLDATP